MRRLLSWQKPSERLPLRPLVVGSYLHVVSLRTFRPSSFGPEKAPTIPGDGGLLDREESAAGGVVLEDRLQPGGGADRRGEAERMDPQQLAARRPPALLSPQAPLIDHEQVRLLLEASRHDTG